MQLSDYIALYSNRVASDPNPANRTPSRSELWVQCTRWATLELGRCKCRSRLLRGDIVVVHPEFGILSRSVIAADWEGAMDVLYLMIPDDLDPKLNRIELAKKDEHGQAEETV